LDIAAGRGRYGEGEQKLAALFLRCDGLGPCVLFLDEIDALAGNRSRELHEASRRMLSVR
jgi:SpoVK/Ycf46/Vps4 family AAA+-type ATPase